MALIRGMHHSLKQVALPLAFTCVAGYFAYHAVNGDRGLLAWRQYQGQILQAKSELERISKERAAMERNVHLLSNSGLDRDMLEERARTMLNFAAPNEKVIFVQQSSTENAAPAKP